MNEASQASSATAKKKRPKKPSLYLYPLRGKIKPKNIGTYDIESKEGTSLTRPGMTRPFLACLFDGERARLFRDRVPFRKKSPQAKAAWRWEHLAPGGCIDKLCRALFSEVYDGRVWYAHNGGTFDHLFILPWLTAHRHLGFDFTVIPVQSTIQVVKVTRKLPGKTLTWTLLDSLRLLPMSLAAACKAFGLPGKTDLDLKTDEDDPRWEEYNARDCMALYEVMQRVEKLMGDLGGEVGITAPASSMKLFRRKYQKERFVRNAHFDGCFGINDSSEECDGCCHDWIRTSYVGGRTEMLEILGGFCRLCFDTGYEASDELSVCPRCKGTGIDPEHFLHYYDINSSYVAALCEPMPVGERIVHEGKLDWSMREKGYVGFAACQVEIPRDCKIPPLPRKDRKTGKLVFPKGKIDGVWSIEELALLEHPLVRGKITWVGRVVWFKAEPVFRQMMHELWGYRDKKREGYDEGLSQLAKLLGNGLYGKFAMALEREEIVFRKGGGAGMCLLCADKLDIDWKRLKDGESPPVLCDSCRGSKVAGADPDADVWYRAKKVQPAYVIPQISAHVTALGRVRLWRYMAMVVEAGGKIMYVDTDSVICNVELPCSTELGALKDEYPGEKLRFAGVQAKVYLLEKEKPFAGEHASACSKKSRCSCKEKICTLCHGCSRSKVTFKGVPKSHRNKETLLFMIGGGESVYRRLEKIRGMAQRGFQGPPKMIDVKRKIVSRYEKRVLHPDGTTSALVYPLAIEPGEQKLIETVLEAEEIEVLD